MRTLSLKAIVTRIIIIAAVVALFPWIKDVAVYVIDLAVQIYKIDVLGQNS